jgi:hypothetical protein
MYYSGIIRTLLAGVIIALLSSAEARPFFNTNTDLLIAQFDSKPDTDDIHAQAALGCMLAHPSLAGVKYYAVAGAYGDQKRGAQFIDSPSCSIWRSVLKTRTGPMLTRTGQAR